MRRYRHHCEGLRFHRCQRDRWVSSVECRVLTSPRLLDFSTPRLDGRDDVYLFLSGAEMAPERVRATWPEARFVARARLEPQAGDEAETWGILITTPEEQPAGNLRQAAADDGRTFSVSVPPADDADPLAVLAAARYWELPPAYVRRLADAANVPVEDYTYG